MASFLYLCGAVKWFVLPLARLQHRASALVVVTLVAFAGCDSGNVSGQVIAVVDGQEITVPELNAEARARGLIIGNDRSLRDRVLQDLIERKLLVQAAVDRQLDRTPEHLLAKRRSDEMLLAGELLGALARQRSSLSEGELAEFIKARPHAFEQRALLSVDRIRVLAALPADVARSIAAARSLDEAQALLASRHIPSDRRLESWDSATFAPKMAQQLIGRARDEIVVVELPGQSVVAMVIEAIPQPTPPANRAQFARELLRSERSQQDLQAVLQQQKTKAKIRYNPSFAPLGIHPAVRTNPHE
jgi:EpsD family peptidyl-prolyl cis-trans isomerase